MAFREAYKALGIEIPRVNTADQFNHLRRITDVHGIDLSRISWLVPNGAYFDLKNFDNSIVTLPAYIKPSVNSVVSDPTPVVKSSECKEVHMVAKSNTQKKMEYGPFSVKHFTIARPNVACRTGEINEPAWEDVFLKSQSELVKIINVREVKLPETVKARTKQAKNFAIDVTIAEKAYIAGHENHAYAELRLIYDRDDTAMLNKTTDNIDDEPRQDRDLHVAKKKATRHLRSASISPELLRENVASRLLECRKVNETTNLLTRDPAIESINHVFGSPYRKRPTTPKEANRFNDLLSRLAAQRIEMVDPAIVAIKAVVTDKEECDPRETADKIVATQEQLAEKARFKRSDSGYLSPPDGTGNYQASGPSNAPTATTPEQSDLAGKESNMKASPDSGIHSLVESSGLNPQATEFVSARIPTRGKVKENDSFKTTGRSDQGYMREWKKDFHHPVNPLRGFEPLSAPIPMAANQVFSADFPHNTNVAPYQDMPPYVAPSMLPPPPPVCPPFPSFPMMHGPGPAFYPVPPTTLITPRLGPHRKPRGHSAMEQQQYEAWLEYKRSTDPTFHQKGRERQQRRAGRQNQ